MEGSTRTRKRGKRAAPEFDSEYVIANETFSGTLETDEVDRVKIGERPDEDGEPEDVFEERPRTIAVPVQKGQIVRTDEPVVAQNPEMFAEYDRNRPPIEQATAAPGERRG